MGSYDSVIFHCPKCGTSIDVQSKVGDCNFKDIPHEAVPVGIAESIVGEKVHCEKCDEHWEVISRSLPAAVRMDLVKV